MAMETAAAILTNLAFEQNKKLKSKLTAAQGKEKELASVMMPLFRQILSEMERAGRTHKFASAVPVRSAGGGHKRLQSSLRRTTKGHDRSEEHDIGGEG